jgi:hypothetical protein
METVFIFFFQLKEFSDQDRIQFYWDLIVSFSPDCLIAQSSGGTVISGIAELGYTKIIWLISARCVQNLHTFNENLPILFSHGDEDNFVHVNKKNFVDIFFFSVFQFEKIFLHCC